RDLMPLRRARNLATPRSWLNTSMPMLVAILLQGGLARMDIFMLEMLGHEASVGLFGAAATVVTLLTMFQQAVLGLVNPLVRPALSEGSGSMREIQARGFRLLVMLIFPASIALLVFGEPILRLFGPSYPQAYAALMILVVGRMISTQLSLTNMWLRFSGGARLIARVMLFALVFNVALNLVLVPSYGMTGAATATASALIGSSVFLSVSMHRRLGISPWPFHALVSGWRRNERV
ncbi:MAG: polysaccharide biosynthesis C-terminal domain-containing protein, partial [Myxococcota bacterium]